MLVVEETLEGKKKIIIVNVIGLKQQGFYMVNAYKEKQSGAK